MPFYYATANAYASDSSHGFSNTQTIYSFTSRAVRADWLALDTRLGTRAVTYREARKLAAGRPSWVRAANDGYLADHHIGRRSDGCLELLY